MVLITSGHLCRLQYKQHWVKTCSGERNVGGCYFFIKCVDLQTLQLFDLYGFIFAKRANHHLCIYSNTKHHKRA